MGGHVVGHPLMVDGVAVGLGRPHTEVAIDDESALCSCGFPVVVPLVAVRWTCT